MIIQSELFDLAPCDIFEIIHAEQPKINRSIYQKMIFDNSAFLTEFKARGDESFDRWFADLIAVAFSLEVLTLKRGVVIKALETLRNDIAKNAREYEEWMRTLSANEPSSPAAEGSPRGA